MGGGPVPGGPGGRFHPAGRDPWAGIGDLGHDEPGDPRSDKQRRDRWDAPTVGRNTPLAAVRGTHRPVRRGKLRVAAVAVVVGGIRAGRDCGGGCAGRARQPPWLASANWDQSNAAIARRAVRWNQLR